MLTAEGVGSSDDCCSGNAITIHSYNYYITNAVKSLQAKGKCHD